MSIAVYPGSFDPIHNGHVDIARRAARLFERVYVAVYDRPSKNLLFTTEERVALAKKALGDVPNIRVVSYRDLTVALMQRLGANVIVRGLRAISDFEWELQLALTNRKLAPHVETVCLMTSIEYAFLSSTIVKDVARHHGDLSSMVPDVVAKALGEKFGYTP